MNAIKETNIFGVMLREHIVRIFAKAYVNNFKLSLSNGSKKFLNCDTFLTIL